LIFAYSFKVEKQNKTKPETKPQQQQPTTTTNNNMSKKVQIYSSSATSSLKIKKDTQSLKFLLEKKHIPYEEIDMAQMDKDSRDKVFFFSPFPLK